MGVPGRDKVLSVNHHLLSFNLGLKQGSKLEQGWHCKAEILLRGIDNGNGCARAVCQMKQKMLHVKTFSGRIKGLLELKCRPLTRGEGDGKEVRKDKKAKLVSDSVTVSYCFRAVPSYPLAWFTSLPRLFLWFSTCCWDLSGPGSIPGTSGSQHLPEHLAQASPPSKSSQLCCPWWGKSWADINTSL